MKTKLLKLLVVMTISITAIFALGLSVSAETVGAFEVTGGTLNTDYTYADGVLTILSDKDITIKNTNPSTPTTDTIVVADGVSANITLAGVNIDVSTTEWACAFKIADNSTGNVTITLADGSVNTLKSGRHCAGLQKNGTFISETQGKLTIQGGELGTGVLNATGGGYGAGIGGGEYGSGSNITIKESTVNATAVYWVGVSGAGIGGGWHGSGSNIIIEDSVVNATAKLCGAGIGGGYDGSGSNITISGGTVTATGGDSGAGIGGGFAGVGSDITISGGTINADEGEDANAIGGGSGRSAVTPTDGNGNNVYLFEMSDTLGKTIIINGVTYPDNHMGESKLYVYLPAAPANEVTINGVTTKYCYDTTNQKWVPAIDIPEEPEETTFTYDGEAKTYVLLENDTYYTITGNVQTNAGNYTVTVSLKDKENTVWSDGTTEDKEYSFVINKAAVTVTAKSYTIKVGDTLPTYAYDVTGLVNNETLPIDLTISCNAADGNTAGTFDIVVSGVAESDNYTFSYVNGTLTVGEKEVVAAPTFTPASGTTFTSSKKVTISCATDGATIYYTTDGSAPTTASTKYTGAITITSTTTIKTIAVKDGMGDSSVVTAKYTKNSGGSGGSGGSSSSSSKESPNIEGKNGKKGWSAILDVIEDTKEGEKIVIDMNDATEIPRNILKEIKGKDITIVLNMDNGFIWTINGKDVENPKTIDMGVKKGTRIPVKVINEVTGESEYIEITLSHNGDFGFKAVLTVDMGKNNKGNFANLYYYNGKAMDIICSDEIDENGKADLTFTHASEYAIVIDDTDHTDLSAGESIKVEEIVLL